MKLNTRAIINRVSLAVGTLPALASNALAVDGAFNGSLQPANTNDIVRNLGLFSDLGQFILEYAIHICVFGMVACTIVISARSLWARSNKKVNEAVEERENLKGLVIDSIAVMIALIVLFSVVVPYISSFVPT